MSQKLKNQKVDNFSFSDKNKKLANEQLAKYPETRKRSALKSILYLAQEQNNGWLSKDTIEYVAKFMNLLEIDVYEVVSFYTMFNLQPVGKYVIYVCTTTPCMLCNSSEILNTLKSQLKIELNETTKDGLFTLKETECIGACIDAPLLKINDTYYEKVTKSQIKDILTKLKSSKLV